MAKRKAKVYPDITKLTGLKWETQNPEKREREAIETCDFCGSNIYAEQKYFGAFTPIADRDDGCWIAVSCQSCGVKAGLEW